MSERKTFSKNNITRWREISADCVDEKRKRASQAKPFAKYSQVRLQCLKLTELKAKTKSREKKEKGCHELNNSRNGK